VKNFRENVLDIKKNKISGTMEIGVYDKYPERAKQIVEFLIYQLNKISTELNVQNARNNREFIEKRYFEAKEQLKIVEDSMRIFQDQYGLAPDIVAKASVQGEVQLEAEIKAEEVKLEMLQKILSPGQSELKLQEEKINLLKKQLNEIKNVENPESSISQKGKPQLVLNYLRLVRSLEIQNKIVLFLLPIYEQARIEEFKEMPSVIVLDAPNVPEKKVKPKRLTITAIAVFATFVMAFGFFVVKEKYNAFASLVKESRNG
jgi:capsule polysaccharide export protein KpsE/RkpR